MSARPALTLPDSSDPVRQKLLGDLLTAAEVCGAFGRRASWLDAQISRGMPFIKVGKARFFNPADVRAWLLSHAVDRGAPRRGRRRGKPFPLRGRLGI